MSDDVKRVQVKDAAGLRKAVDDGAEFVLFNGDEPVARVTPIALALEKSKEWFQAFPHPASECLWTCWRHPRTVPEDEEKGDDKGDGGGDGATKDPKEPVPAENAAAAV
jgi:antitoxin (DNA-binding transcriptional repressor) of toxin-antitoxin stability system